MSPKKSGNRPAVTPGTVFSARARRGHSNTPEAYDFRHPIKLSREHTRTLQIALEGYARQVTTVFTSMLRTVCQVNLDSINQQTYAEYIDSLPPSTYLTLFSLDPVPGRGVLEMPLNVTMTCVDHMLGGPGSGSQPSRTLSEIEQNLVRRLIERLLSELSYSVRPIAAIAAEPNGVEYSPQFAQAASATDVVIVVTFEVKIDDGDHALTLCLPFNGLLPYLSAAHGSSMLSARERAAREEATRRLEEAVQDIPVEVAVRLRPTEVDPAALRDLGVGMTIRLDHPASAPLDVAVDDNIFAHASVGTAGRRAIARVIATAEKEN